MKGKIILSVLLFFSGVVSIFYLLYPTYFNRIAVKVGVLRELLLDTSGVYLSIVLLAIIIIGGGAILLTTKGVKG